MSSQEPSTSRRAIVAWAFYDWANSAYATTIMAGFFPLFFKQYASANVEATVSTLRLGLANTCAGFIVALLAPVLGAIADRGGSRKRFLLAFMLLGAALTAGLATVGHGEWQRAWICFVGATIGFIGANVFYDSLIIDVAPPGRYERVSALGFGLGYLGGGLLFTLNVAMTLSPRTFGLVDTGDAVRWSFVTVAVWWVVFTLPLLAWVRERPLVHRERSVDAIAAGLRQLVATFRELRALRTVALFLVAYWLYIDGVDTIITMAVDYGLSIGLPQSALITALLITQFVGFPAAIAFGFIGTRIGPRNAILIGIAVYIFLTVGATQMAQARDFYVLAIVVGLVQGGVQSLSRALYAQLIPPEKSGEFFGFYNMMGKFAAVLGPLLVGWTAVATGSSRYAVLAIAVLFIVGGAVLLRVNVPPVHAGSSGVGALPGRG
jgi:UMF1 family MFS transporter